MKARRALENFKQKILGLGKNTAMMNVFGKKIVTTIEPENIKQVLSLGFKDWGIGEQRKKVMEPFLGAGIFTSDGAEVSFFINFWFGLSGDGSRFGETETLILRSVVAALAGYPEAGLRTNAGSRLRNV